MFSVPAKAWPRIGGGLGRLWKKFFGWPSMAAIYEAGGGDGAAREVLSNGVYEQTEMVAERHRALTFMDRTGLLGDVAAHRSKK